MIRGKARLVNRVACDVFELLGRHGIPTAFRRRYDDTSFIATRCDMVPFEVVVRFEAGDENEGSYKKRNPDVPAGHRFPKPIVEFYLKTTGRKWGDRELPCDDPILDAMLSGIRYGVHLPNVPISEQSRIFVITCPELGLSVADIGTITRLALDVGAVLSAMFYVVRVNLVDFKMEVGRTPAPERKLVVADLIAPDEWRANTDIGKEGFRKGEPVEVTRARYELAAVLTGHFPK